MTWFIVYRTADGAIDNISHYSGENMPVPEGLPVPDGHAMLATEHGYEVGRKTHVVIGHPDYPIIAPKETL